MTISKNFGEQISCVFLKKGVYFLRVSINPQSKNEPKYIVDNHYFLHVQNFHSPLPASQEYVIEKEPNSSFNRVQVVSLNSSILGYYTPSKNFIKRTPLTRKFVEYLSKKVNKNLKDYNIDLYSFKTPKDKDLLTSLKLTSTIGFNPIIALFNTDLVRQLGRKNPHLGSVFSVIKDDNLFGIGESINYYKIKKNTSYIVAIIAQNEFHYKPFISSQKQFYRLFINTVPLSSNYENEPNNSLETANSIDHSVIKGTLESYKENDLFIVKPTKKPLKNMVSTLDLKLQSDLNIPLEIQILNEKGVIIRNISEHHGKIHIPNLLFSQTFYISVHLAPSDSSPLKTNLNTSYSITLKQKSVPFLSKNKMEIESLRDNIFEYKFELPVSIFQKTVRGFINYEGDSDHFFFIAPKSQKYKVDFTSNIKTPFVLKLYNSKNILIHLFKTNGIALKQNKTIFLKKDQKILITLETLSGKSLNTEKPYFLSIYPVSKNG